MNAQVRTISQHDPAKYPDFCRDYVLGLDDGTLLSIIDNNDKDGEARKAAVRELLKRADYKSQAKPTKPRQLSEAKYDRFWTWWMENYSHRSFDDGPGQIAMEAYKFALENLDFGARHNSIRGC